MNNYNEYNDKRKEQRVPVVAKIKISIGTQFTVEGQIKDLTVNSAFILMRNNIYLNTNDDVLYEFQVADYVVKGKANVTRIVKGEGFVICFMNLDPVSQKNLMLILQ